MTGFWQYKTYLYQYKDIHMSQVADKHYDIKLYRVHLAPDGYQTHYFKDDRDI